MKNVVRSLMLAVVACGSSLILLGNASAHDGHGHGDFRYPTWHDTSHFDYHPGSFQQHGNHFHYTSGHFDLHQTGHFDR